MLDANIKKLVQYGIDTELISETERIYSTNLLLDLFDKKDFTDPDISNEDIILENVLFKLCDEAYKLGIIETA